MVLVGAVGSESRFAAYVEGLATVIGHKDRVGPLRDYCTGLMLPCERKSVEPMAAVTAPARTAAQHQSLLHFVGEGGWSDERVLGKVREIVLPAIERQGSVEAWSGGGVALAGQSACEPAGGLAALSAGRVGGRPRAAAQGTCAGAD